MVNAYGSSGQSFIENAYIIEFDEMPTSHLQHHHHQRRRTSFYDDLQYQNISHQVRQEFQFINAVSLSFATDQDVDLFMKTAKGIKRTWPVRVVSTPNVEFSTAIQTNVASALFEFYNTTGVNRVHEEFNLRGKGIKVGIIDTGVDYTHPALGGCFGPGCRVAFGYDFVGDEYNGENDATPDPDPRDICNGHGTHVAGIVGAKDLVKNFTGVAPEATLGAYRIFGCAGSSADDIIMKAMERAYLDGMDIINLSLGDNGWPKSPASLLADKLALLGMAVCAAAGNEGEKGIFEVGAPSLGRHAISIASVDNSMVLAHSIKLGDTNFGYTTTSGKAFDVEDTDIVPVSTKFSSENDGCNPIDINLKDKVALIARGGCVFAVKVRHAQEAGAVAALIYNNVFGLLTPSAQDHDISIPYGGLSQEDGKTLFDNAMRAQDGNKYTFLKNEMGFNTPTAGWISSFSSWGLGPDLSIKPDITAPGGLIYSTYPVTLGSYATLSGTSMSSPFVAGIVALLHQSRGNGRSFPPDELRTRLINNAHPVKVVDSSVPESVARQGGGLIDVYQALKSTTSISPEHLRLNDASYGNPNNEYTFTIMNKDRMEMEYTISHVSSATVQGYEPGANGQPIVPLAKPKSFSRHEADATINIPTPMIKIRPNESVNVTVQITPPSGSNVPSIYSGYLLIEKDNGKESLYLPYAGLTTKMSAIPVLLMNDSMPFMMGDRVHRETPGFLSFQMSLASELVMVMVADANNGTKTYGWIPGGYSNFVGRNDLRNPADVYTLQWFGTVVTVREMALNDLSSVSSRFHPYTFAASLESMKKPMMNVGEPLPPGEYRLKIMALRAFGDEHNIQHYDIWTSSPIMVDG
ncbi:peptidase S8/S53 domain-containing protein [Halteromyces radiatus]|uniref:peptidase S8/S53 domain-containing protein n=1 Tax=Halteromyces radiatus TaxID=101107 RepID=UPI00221E7E26|nr:peptidase S8/S53 domain-containing protein [Halteromyces radiatus]KAI8088927.1 peptidase S8/S53 domain-containing protein [Halteromyces radiatus]